MSLESVWTPPPLSCGDSPYGLIAPVQWISPRKLIPVTKTQDAVGHCHACQTSTEVDWRYCPLCGSSFVKIQREDTPLSGPATSLSKAAKGAIRSLAARAHDDLRAIEGLANDSQALIAQMAEQPSLSTLIELSEWIGEVHDEGGETFTRLCSSSDAVGARASRTHITSLLRRARRMHQRMRAADQRFVTLGSDGRIRLHEALSGSILEQWSGHEGRGTCIESLPDGQHVLTGGEDGTVRYWSLPERRCLAIMHTHPTWISSLLPLDDTSAISFGGDGRAVLLDLADHRVEPLPLCDGRHSIGAACLSLDGTIAVGDVDGRIVLSHSMHVPARELLDLNVSINDLIWTPAGRLIAALGSGEIAIIDPRGHEPLHRIDFEGEWLQCLDIDPVNGMIAIGQGSGHVILFDLGELRILERLTVTGDWPSTCRFDGETGWLRVSTANGIMWSWSTEESMLGPSTNVFEGAVMGFANIAPAYSSPSRLSALPDSLPQPLLLESSLDESG